MKKIIRNCFIVFSLFYFSETFANSDDIETEVTRNSFVFYFSPYKSDQYKELFPFRKRRENNSFTFLYGITNNLYLGLNYSSGDNPNTSTFLGQNTGSKSFTLFKDQESRIGEYFTLKSQYFIFNDFYLSLNIGLERGHKITRNNIFIEENSVQIEPLVEKTIYSNRMFSTVGIGYRLEFYDNFIVGIEYEYGMINSGKRKSQYTFNPDIYDEVPRSISLPQFIFFNQRAKRSEYSLTYIYFGLSF